MRSTVLLLLGHALLGCGDECATGEEGCECAASSQCQSGLACRGGECISCNGHVWSTSIEGDPWVQTLDVATDPTSATYVATCFYDTAACANNRGSLVRFDPDGRVEWTREILGGALAAGPSGEVIVAGSGFLAKLAASGEAIWSLPFPPAGDLEPFILDVDVAPDGAVVVTGGVTRWLTGGWETAELWIRAFTEAGDAAWTTDLPLEAWAPKLAVDDEGRVFVIADEGAGVDEVHVRAFDLEVGDLLWDVVVPGTEGYGIATAGPGEVVALADTLTKLDADGSVVWSEPSGAGFARFIAADEAGRSFVAGTDYGSDVALRMRMFDENGDAIWTRSCRADAGGPNESVEGIAVLPDGDIVVAAIGEDVHDGRVFGSAVALRLDP